MSALRTTYKTIRSIVFAAITIVVALYVMLYVVISVPGIHNSIKSQAEKEISNFLGSKIKIGRLTIHPFNEVKINDVTLFTPDGKRCLDVNTLGAGINLWKLIREQKVEITYAEVIGMNARIWQTRQGAPLNIQFIIDAANRNKSDKKPSSVDVKLQNVVVRRSIISFDKLWCARGAQNRFDANHIRLSDLKIDMRMPCIKKNDIQAEVRRISFRESSGFVLNRLAFNTRITDKTLSVSDFQLEMPHSQLMLSDIALRFESIKDLKTVLIEGRHKIELNAPYFTPSDIKAFVPFLANQNEPLKVQTSLEGSVDALTVERLLVSDLNGGFDFNFGGELGNLTKPSRLECRNLEVKLDCDAMHVNRYMSLIPSVKANVKQMIERLGAISVEVTGSMSLGSRSAEGELLLESGAGDLTASLQGQWPTAHNVSFDYAVETTGFDVQRLLPNLKVGNVVFTADGRVNNLKELDADLNLDADYLEYNGVRIQDLLVKLGKSGARIDAEASSNDDKCRFALNGFHVIDGGESETYLYADIDRLSPGELHLFADKRFRQFSGRIEAHTQGNSVETLIGSAFVNNPVIVTAEGKEIAIGDIYLKSSKVERIDGITDRRYRLKSNLLEGELQGDFNITSVTQAVQNILATCVPAVVEPKPLQNPLRGDASFRFAILPHEEWGTIFKLPVVPLDTLKVKGGIDLAHQSVKMDLQAPYVVQGDTKLIKGSAMHFQADAVRGLKGEITTTLPMKSDNTKLSLNADLFSNRLYATLNWQAEKEGGSFGIIQGVAGVNRNPITNKNDFFLNLKPSGFKLNNADWVIEGAKINYSNGAVDVKNLRAWHDAQFLSIEGKASANPEDEMRVNMAGIDLKYIFDILNINYVSFGGLATGEITASNIMSGRPVASTKELFVKDFSYNGEVLGDGLLESHWDNEQKMVAINADVDDKDGNGADIRGGIYVTRDSLSFEMDAHKVNIGFIAPFLSTFASHVGGRASGKIKLFGTFRDIDLDGRVFADSLSMTVAATNVTYHGTDSVIIKPGYIDIPAFRAYDRYGHSAIFSGYLKHEHFRDAVFDFRVTNANQVLGFETTQAMNPIWFGRIFASGGLTIKGQPGVTAIVMDLTSARNSEFNLILNTAQTAVDYSFLTFSDRNRVVVEEEEEEFEFLKRFRKKQIEKAVGPKSLFTMDLRANITPDARLNLVIDPRTGDKITARGSGPLQISYDTDANDVKIYGKYTLSEGIYNFSLQDLILRDFKINAGSSISFNGDPMSGVLDINAAYRVNTNISDLDKSFSTDKDLNRTNVPVDALLYVKGDISSPEINFDIALPTLTQETERKVKSIISTDDMMNRQMIYLLALNKFYTPEYMSTTGNGGELASMASTTISSQLTNMMGQLTDKFTLAPSFRSDKGDFSDMEVDVALSSSLFDNRLLLNGNFGYRDKTTSQTTFVGDFDIEYLLNRGGNFRLKAYNHFNDQNYYLKSALTTQGIGVIYRRDFDNPFKRRGKSQRKERNIVNNKKESLILPKSETQVVNKTKK